MYRYIGDRSRMLPAITEAVRSAVGRSGTVADMMAGTGIVSQALRLQGYTVKASDLLVSPMCHLTARLLLQKPPAFTRLEDAGIIPPGGGYNAACRYLDTLPPAEGFFFREYAPLGEPKNGATPRRYFTPENAAHIDAARAAIRFWEEKKFLTGPETALLKHTLIMAAGRYANISGTYSHFLAIARKEAIRPLRITAERMLPGGPDDHMIRHGDAAELARYIRADVCFLDPPSRKIQYATEYHIPETIARGDEPKLAGWNGIRHEDVLRSQMTSRQKTFAALEQIIRRMDCPWFLIAFSHGGFFTPANMLTFLDRFGTVTMREVHLPEDAGFMKNKITYSRHYLCLLRKRAAVT